MNRREFIKTLCSVAAISVVPAIGFAVQVPEPTWFIEEFEYGSELGVCAQWISGETALRNAVAMPIPSHEFREEAIQHCKQALRQWYLERHYHG